MAHRYTIQSTERMEDILLLTLAPKNKGHRLNFEPGQYATIGFIRGFRPTPMRCFSIVSTPSSGVLQFAMRVRGNFTEAAAKLRPGTIVRVQGPFGDFTLNPEYDHNVVMLAAGIGITPFLSMIRDATDRKMKIPITLWYANRTSSRIPFYGQLNRMAVQNPYFRIKFFSADTEGKITDLQLQHLKAESPNDTTYFVCGPRGFSENMQSTLLAEGVHESRILNESFAQSSSIKLDSGLSIHSLTYGLSAAALVLITGGIMLLDLRQNIPKLTAVHATAPTQSTNLSNTPSEDSGSSYSSNGSDSANSGTNTQTPATTPTQNSSPNYTYYQPPVSSVS